MNIFKSRKFRQGSVATAITLVVIAVIVILNMVVTMLSDRYSLSIDMTTEKLFAISEDSREFLAKLDKDVSIYVMMNEESFISGGDYFVQANEVIKKYATQSNRIKVSYINLLQNPTFAANYPDVQLGSSDILIVSEGKSAKLTPYELFNIQSDQYTGQVRITASKAEQAMTSAILNVTSDKKILVSVLTGHNEYAPTGFISMLEMNNYESTTQNLLTEEVDPDATIAILSAPMRDLTEEELQKLDKYLVNGGKYDKTLFYLASNDQPELPRLGAFLADWGIAVSSGVAFETNQNMYLNLSPFMPVVNYGTSEMAAKIAEGVKGRDMIATVPVAHPLEILFEAKGGVMTTSLLEFSQTSGIRPQDADENWQPAANDLSGPYPALAMGQMTKYDGTTPMQSTVLVCGSSVAIDDGLLTSPSIANSEYFLTLMDNLAKREDVIRIQSKTIGASELGITTGQAIVIGLVITVLFPLALFIFGIVIWLRRRHR